MQFPFLPEGVKWKVVKNIHCPPLLIDTGLMSICPLTKKLLQKHRPVSYSKKQRKLALSPRSLTESSAQSELSRLDAHWDRLCGLVLNYIKGKLWKIRLWNMISFALLAVTLFRFFGASRFGVIAVYRWMCHEYRKQNQLNPALCVPSVWHARTCPPVIIRYFKLNPGCQTDLYAKMEMFAWIPDIYRYEYDRKLNVFCTEDTHACVTAPDRASLYTNALT